MQLRFLAESPLWRSLRHRNYRLYLTGQLVSVCGTWMQQVAQSWLVYRLTGSATLLGVVGFATQIPVFALGAIGGVVSDRYSSHRVAVWTQSAALLQAIILSVLTLTGWVQPVHIIILGTLLGIVNSFDMPARQALMHRLVDIDDLANAVALNSSMINAARIIGPSIAGLIVAGLGEGVCFLINAASYSAVIVALLAMKFPPQEDSSVTHLSLGSSLVAGIRYTAAMAPIRDTLLLLAAVGFMGMPYITLMPVFAADIHRGGANALGLMMGAVGVGGRNCAPYQAWRHSVIGLGRVIAIAAIGFGTVLVAFTLAKTFWLTLLLLMVVGMCWMMLIAGCNTALQTLSDNAMRGRVMSLFSMMLIGMAPFGSLLAGWCADRIGAPLVVAGGGTVCALAGLVFATQLPRLRAAARPILIARGVIIEPTTGGEAVRVDPT
jgi:MFS family permease